jgi:hypothetical protein
MLTYADLQVQCDIPQLLVVFRKQRRRGPDDTRRESILRYLSAVRATPDSRRVCYRVGALGRDVAYAGGEDGGTGLGLDIGFAGAKALTYADVC